MEFLVYFLFGLKVFFFFMLVVASNFWLTSILNRFGLIKFLNLHDFHIGLISFWQGLIGLNLVTKFMFQFHSDYFATLIVNMTILFIINNSLLVFMIFSINQFNNSLKNLLKTQWFLTVVYYFLIVQEGVYFCYFFLKDFSKFINNKSLFQQELFWVIYYFLMFILGYSVLYFSIFESSFLLLISLWSYFLFFMMERLIFLNHFLILENDQTTLSFVELLKLMNSDFDKLTVTKLKELNLFKKKFRFYYLLKKYEVSQ